MLRRKPKILIIGTTDCKGGAASVGWNIGETLRSRGYSVKYIVGFKFSGSTHVHELKKPWLTSTLEKYLPYHFTGIYRHFCSFILANDIGRGAGSEILDHAWYKDADIILCQNLHGSYFKLETLSRMSQNKKVFWTLHDMWAISGNCVYTDDPEVWKSGTRAKVSIMEYPPMLWNNAKYLWSKKRDIYRNSPTLFIIVPSKWLGDKVKESILKDKRLSVIYNGINTDTFKPGDKIQLREKYGLPQNVRIVSFVAQGGGYDPRKGWNYIEDIARSYEADPSVLFMCIGGGKSVQVNNILYVPNISDKKILSEHYALSDAFLFTSLAENCPLVVLEAMSCGLPVVSFDVGGVPELVGHKKNGYISKYKDDIELSLGLKWVLGLSSKELDKISKSNRSEIQSKYSIDKMVDAYENLFTTEK